MKKLIAYSSVAHMGFVTIGIFTLNPQGIQGSIFQMLSHGLVSGALFLCVGVVYDRMHSREIATLRRPGRAHAAYAVVFMLFMLASVGLPGTSGFVGEFLVMIGVFQVDTWVAALAATGMILGAAYMLWLYRRVIFGALHQDDLRDDPRPAPARDRGVRAARRSWCCGWASIRRCSSTRWRPRSTSCSAQAAAQPAAETAAALAAR